MVRIITDSTSSIPQDIHAELGIEVTSLIINRNGEELVESETDLDAFYKDIYEMADNIPTSSQPPLGKVREVVESIAKTGDEVLGIFISSKLSGTFESFVHTAKEVKNDLPNFRFAAIDSMTTCMEMGWPAIAAAKAATTAFRRRTQACIPRDSCSPPNRCCSCRRAAASEKPPRSSAT